ncbi:CE1 family esterase [Azospirillum argentinense]
MLILWAFQGLSAELVNNVAVQQLSRGCGVPAPAPVLDRVTLDGVARGVIVAVPAGYRPDHPHSLVVAFHGRTNSNAEVRRYFGLEGQAGEPAIVVYPASLKDARGLNIWSDPGDPPDRLRDFRLFDAVLESMAASYCIDMGRVFVVGHSLGGSFANSLACARAGVIRGLASVGGGSARPKDCGGPVAAMVLHNPRDEQVPVSEALRLRRALLAQDGLPTGSEPDEPHLFNCRRYGAEGEENPILWCPLADDRTRNGRFYPHHWPQGVGAAIMAFFARLD